MPATSNTPSPRGSSRERLLDAAADLITRHGVQDLTLDAVATAAGVTKGGLIYHFKTKDELLGALVERMIEQLDRRQRAKAARRGTTKSALLLALVDETFDMPRSEKQLLTNLLAAGSAYPHLLGPVRKLFTQMYGELTESGAQAGPALVIAAALDGITLLELLDFHQFTKRQREAMRQALLELIKPLS
jgi:AcrR family transcriptional regulator